jgi:hypothetical protein
VAEAVLWKSAAGVVAAEAEAGSLRRSFEPMPERLASESAQSRSPRSAPSKR